MPEKCYREPSEIDKEQSDSADDEPYKEPRETTIVQYVTTSTTEQLHKLHPRLKARLVADGRNLDLSKCKGDDRKPSQAQERGETRRNQIVIL